jgi:hypothetical protein
MCIYFSNFPPHPPFPFTNSSTYPKLPTRWIPRVGKGVVLVEGAGWSEVVLWQGSLSAGLIMSSAISTTPLHPCWDVQRYYFLFACPWPLLIHWVVPSISLPNLSLLFHLFICLPLSSSPFLPFYSPHPLKGPPLLPYLKFFLSIPGGWKRREWGFICQLGDILA